MLMTKKADAGIRASSIKTSSAPNELLRCVRVKIRRAMKNSNSAERTILKITVALPLVLGLTEFGAGQEWITPRGGGCMLAAML
jgi:hypothetical protein